MSSHAYGTPGEIIHTQIINAIVYRLALGQHRSFDHHEFVAVEEDAGQRGDSVLVHDS